MHPNEYFDEIYCINLERRSDRWANMLRRFNTLNIKVQKIKAIDGKEIGITGNEALYKTNINIFEEAIYWGYKKIWIIEDDCMFNNDFLINFDTHCENIPDYDAWFMGAIVPEVHKLKCITNNYFIHGHYIYGTHSMAYKVDFLPIFKKAILERKDYYPIDCLLSERINAKKFVSVNPMLCVQGDDISDIVDRSSQKDIRKFNEKNYF